MDEAGWLACTDPLPMLKFLERRASDRKLRLFAAACCRRVWHKMPAQRCRDAVEFAERFADGGASKADLSGMYWSARTVYVRTGAHYAVAACGAVRESCNGAEAAEYAARAARRKREPAAQCALLRCAFGSPFRPAAVEPGWLAWEGGTVRRLAEAAYEQRLLPSGMLDNDRLAVLADALEEAGCQDAGLLGHLRSGGSHYRGCWVLDRLLGKS